MTTLSSIDFNLTQEEIDALDEGVKVAQVNALRAKILTDDLPDEELHYAQRLFRSLRASLDSRGKKRSTSAGKKASKPAVIPADDSIFS